MLISLQIRTVSKKLSYGADVVKDNPYVIKEANDVVKETDDVVKEKANVTKEFAKAQRQIYKLISQTPQISVAQMSENMGISLRQVQRYLKQLSDQNLIVREGGRKMAFGKSWTMNTKVSLKEYKR